ncbi:MAG: transporter substrate-binding domain-containing protein [Spirochaetes bacterium]|nr:transporter substrate-binding domain-containing protein [Spirochaetota bacterium]
MKKIIVFILFIIVSSFFRLGLFPQNKLVPIITWEFPPYTSQNLENYGFESEIVLAAFKEVNIEVNFQFFPWKRGERMVDLGEAWGTIPYSITKERMERYYFTDPIATVRVVFFYYGNKMQGTTWNQYDDLKSYTIGGALGYFYEPIFKEAGLNVDYADDYKQSFIKLVYDRVDLVPIPEIVGWQYIQEMFPEKSQYFGILEKPLRVNQHAIMISKNYPNTLTILSNFNQGLKEIKKNGIYAKITEKYFLK